MERAKLISFLEELRRRLIIIAVTVFLTAIVCFAFVEEILEVLTRPGKGLGMELIFIAPEEALMADLRLAFVSAALVTLPFLLYQLVALIMALAGRRRRHAFLLTLAMYILFALGVAFAYGVAFPFALRFFLGFTSEDLVATFTIQRYLSFAITFILSFGLIFQLPLVFWLLGSIGVVNAEFLRRNRKYALLIIVIVAAIITPPDVFSLILMSLPLLLLYEVGILLVAISQRRREGAVSQEQ